MTHLVIQPIIPRAKPPGASARWWSLAALALAGLIIGLDITILNVALPDIATALHASTGQLQWFGDAYTLVVGVAMLPVANLGDRYGRKRLLVASLVLFAAASAWCAYAGSPGELIAARATLGLAGAALLPLGFAMLPVLFPDQSERAKATAIWAAVSTVALPLGPLLGGWLLEHFWWGSVFLLSVPLALVGVIALIALLPESRSARPLRLDGVGTILSSAGLAGVIYGLIRAGQSGWGSGQAWAPILIGLVLLIAFLAWERHSSNPLIDLGLFANAKFCWGTVHATIANFALFGLLFVMPQYFQGVHDTQPLGTGIRLLPMIGGMVVGTQAGSKLAGRLGAGVVIAAGFALSAVALVAAAFTQVDTGYGFAAAWIACLGLGVGLALPASMAAAVGELSAERAGAGSGLLQALRQVGGSIGIAILGTVLNSGYHAQVPTHDLSASMAQQAREGVAAGVQVAHHLHDPAFAHDVRAAFVHGMDLTLAVCGGLALAGAILAAAFMIRRPGRGATPEPQRETITA